MDAGLFPVHDDKYIHHIPSLIIKNIERRKLVYPVHSRTLDIPNSTSRNGQDQKKHMKESQQDGIIDTANTTSSMSYPMSGDDRTSDQPYPDDGPVNFGLNTDVQLVTSPVALATINREGDDDAGRFKEWDNIELDHLLN